MSDSVFFEKVRIHYVFHIFYFLSKKIKAARMRMYLVHER
ncbi:hypothetical protein LEP1GSC016_4109 [Leptospira borgpetersenii serovar Hardjo-bovis str. Sponselee]|uniref:Uncharacterized protein n=1 Tax=Leptospira borgpetersenii serovar Hardjo-bovis str. Sponselee TaxID=1303729 RepID=M6BYA5_LEPBO|nr:hypothetical protein LEP1GSC016_4109 [Leptospira borgpetersenii serovar Hardjo-bovis str. Sponselee]